MKMVTSKLFGTSTMDLPKFWDRSVSFTQFLSETFGEYANLINSLDPADAITSAIKNESTLINHLCNSLISCLDKCLQGSPRSAIEELSTTLKSLDDDIERFLVRSKNPSNLGLGKLYRARVSGESNLSREQLFHIPFDDIQKVRAHRYSVKGSPSLYLSNSIFTAWNELGRPSLHKLHVSKFELSTDIIRVLDFGIRPIDWNRVIPRLRKENLIALSVISPRGAAEGVCWPLIAACSIAAVNGEMKENHRYILPQLIFQWVRSSQAFHGIRYFSTGRQKQHYPLELSRNFAFPAFDEKTSGYCSALKTMFKLTEPISMEKLFPPVLEISDKEQNNYETIYDLSTIKGYLESPLGIAQLKLDELEASEL